MDPNNLLQLADVAMLRGDPHSSYNPSPITSPTPSVATERLPAYQPLRHFPSMPHINTIPQQNAHSPPPLNRAPAPITSVRPPQASPDTRGQQTPDRSPADFIQEISSVLERFEFGIYRLAPTQSSQSSHSPPQVSPSSTLALSECEPRRNPVPTLQTFHETGAVGVRFTLPAIGQRTGANPSPPSLAKTTSTPPLSPWVRSSRRSASSTGQTYVGIPLAKSVGTI